VRPPVSAEGEPPDGPRPTEPADRPGAAGIGLDVAERSGAEYERVGPDEDEGDE